jgi:enoyl-CoA hydratase
MTAQTIRVNDGGAIRRIVIDRPDKANALTAAMMHALAEAMRGGFHADVILLEGNSERGFSAGADIAEFLQGDEHLQRQEQGLKDIVSAFVDSPRPIIAAIHGRTLGAGVLLAALSDLVIAADNLMFGLPEVRFNMYPVVVHAVLEEKISPALAFQLCATGRLLTAAEARGLGLVSDVVPIAKFATEVAERVAFYQKNAEALTIGRRALRTTRPSEVYERIVRLAPLMHENFSRPGVRETIARYFRH